MDDISTRCSWDARCTEPCVSGSQYCEDHLLQSQVRAIAPAPSGTLAALIRKANMKGMLKPVSGYAGH
jgi:hypothetical protein